MDMNEWKRATSNRSCIIVETWSLCEETYESIDSLDFRRKFFDNFILFFYYIQEACRIQLHLHLV